MEKLIQQTRVSSRATLNMDGPLEDINLHNDSISSCFLLMAAETTQFNIRVSTVANGKLIASAPVGVKTWAFTLSSIFKSDPTNAKLSMNRDSALETGRNKFRLSE
jgi:hypothetical protein